MFDDIPLQIVADFVRIPLRPGNEMLEILRRFIAQVIRQLPAILVIDLCDQPLHVKRSPSLNLHSPKPGSHLFTNPLQFPTPTLNVSC